MPVLWILGAVLMLGSPSPGQDVGYLIPTRTFQIRFPREFKSESVMIQYGIYGRGGVFGEVRTTKGIHDYVLRVDDLSGEIRRATSLKLLLYAPGYQMVAAEIDFARLGAPYAFTPVPVTLPKLRMSGQLVDSAHMPLPGQTLTLTYTFIEAMRYFGYIDGMVPTIKIDTVITDLEGRFSFEIPDFAKDPFFQRYRSDKYAAGRFYMSSENRQDGPDDKLSPTGFTVQTIYPKPFIVTKTLHGTLRGRLSGSFLREYGSTGDLTSYIRSVDSAPFSIRLEARTMPGQRSYNAMVQADGTFLVNLPPGTYVLRLFVFGPGSTLKHEIPLQAKVVIKEGQTTDVSTSAN